MTEVQPLSFEERLRQHLAVKHGKILPEDDSIVLLLSGMEFVLQDIQREGIAAHTAALHEHQKLLQTVYDDSLFRHTNLATRALEQSATTAKSLLDSAVASHLAAIKNTQTPPASRTPWVFAVCLLAMNLLALVWLIGHHDSSMAAPPARLSPAHETGL